MDKKQEASWSDLFGRKNFLYSVILSVGVALDAVNIYISTTILPSVLKDIGGIELYSWSTTLFILTSVLGASLTSVFLQKIEVKSLYILASLSLIFGSAVSTVAPNMIILLLGRLLQGFGGGILFAASYFMIMFVYKKSLWTRAMALLSGMWGIATLSGPAIGGIFAEFYTWRLAFGIMIPIVFVYMLLAHKVLSTIYIKIEKSFDSAPIKQLIFLSLSILSISFASLYKSVLINIGGVFISFCFIYILIKIDLKSRHKLMPFGSFNPQKSLFWLFFSLFLLIIGTSSETFIPYFLQNLHSFTPLEAGYCTSLLALGWLVAEIYSSRWSGALANKSIFFGPIIAVGASFLLSVFMISSSNLITIMGIMLWLSLVGFGIGFGWPHLCVRVLETARSGQEKRLVASAISTVDLFGTGFGTALAGVIVNLCGFNNGTLVSTSRSSIWLFVMIIVILSFAFFTSRKALRFAKK